MQMPIERNTTKRQTTTSKTPYRKMKIAQHESHYWPGVNSCS